MAEMNFGGVIETVVTSKEFSLEKAREVLKNETIAVIGYGIQGPGQACNLRDNGFNVIVGQREGKTYEKAKADGWVPGKTLFSIEEAAEKGTIICMLLSDAGQIQAWPKIKKYLTPGKALYYSHGFAINWSDRTGVVPPADIDVIMVAPKGSGTSLRTMFCEGRGLNCSYAVYQDATGKALYYSHGFAINWSDRTGVVPPADVDVIMVAPKGSGTSLRTMFCEGRGLNCSYAVYQDATGKAEEKTIAFGIGIGAGYMFKTTFQREATSDLTGERGSLMGAIEGLLEAQYDVLRENGHSPSEAFNETVEELTQSLMPLFAQKGMDWMYANCSTTAQRGALDWAPRFRDAIKPVMEWLYYSVKTGNEAQISIDSNSKPDYRDGLNKELEAMRNKEMWRAAETVRKLRPENNED